MTPLSPRLNRMFKRRRPFLLQTFLLGVAKEKFSSTDKND